MVVSAEYDGIVIGAGHNGLILQAYLAKAGLKTLVVERSAQVGGGLHTVSAGKRPDAPLADGPRVAGFRHNVHAVFLRGITGTPWFRDLDLASYGARLIEPAVNLALHLEDGRCFVVHREAEATARSLARFSQRDADTFLRLRDYYERVVDEVMVPELAAPPLAKEETHRLLARSESGRRYLEAAALSAREFVEQHFESDAVKCLLLAICVLREVDVHIRGMGYVPAQLIGARGKAQLAVGGSGELARAMERCVRAHHGAVLVNEAPRRIVVEQGVAKGIELSDGSFIGARRFIASSLNPIQTLLDLVGPDHLPLGLDARVERYRFSVVGPLFGVHLALQEAPEYRGVNFDADAARSFMNVVGLDRPEQIYELHQRLSAGQLPERIWMNGATPTLHDPTQGSDGKQTAFVWQKVPYALGGDGDRWDAMKEGHMAAVLARWREYAPNLTNETILDRFAVTPRDTERRLPNMARGDLNVGWLDEEQSGAGRPLPELSQYRTPIKGLYLCGACTYPGGNITGFPGYNAAGVIAKDLGLARWWAGKT